MKVINLTNKKKEYIFEEVANMLTELSEYEIKISLNRESLRIIFEEIYNMYEKKNISIGDFRLDILTYFNEIMASCLEEKEEFSYEYVLDGFKYFQEIYSPVEITTKEMAKTLKKTRKKLGGVDNGKWECY